MIVRYYQDFMSLHEKENSREIKSFSATTSVHFDLHDNVKV